MLTLYSLSMFLMQAIVFVLLVVVLGNFIGVIKNLVKRSDHWFPTFLNQKRFVAIGFVIAVAVHLLLIAPRLNEIALL